MFCEAFSHWHEFLRALQVFRVCRLVARGEFRKLAVLIFANLGPFTFLLPSKFHYGAKLGTMYLWGPCDLPFCGHLT